MPSVNVYKQNKLPIDSFSKDTAFRAYIPSIFISAALPLRDVNKEVFDRKYNNITLHLTSPNKVPYGKYGRLLLSILTTHAVLNKNSPNSDGTVTIQYETLQALLDEMQLPKQRSGDIKEQLNRFKSATFTYDGFEETIIRTSEELWPELATDNKRSLHIKKFQTGNIMFIDSLQYMELNDGLYDKRSIAFKIILSARFVNLCKNHSVPIDYSIYKEISSALGKDLYAWLIYRNNSIDSNGIFIPRTAMVSQFMPTKSYAQKDQERANFKYIIEQISQIKAKYCPTLRFAVDKDFLGFYLYHSPNITSSKDTRYILITGENLT